MQGKSGRKFFVPDAAALRRVLGSAAGSGARQAAARGPARPLLAARAPGTRPQRPARAPSAPTAYVNLLGHVRDLLAPDRRAAAAQPPAHKSAPHNPRGPPCVRARRVLPRVRVCAGPAAAHPPARDSAPNGHLIKNFFFPSLQFLFFSLFLLVVCGGPRQTAPRVRAPSCDPTYHPRTRRRALPPARLAARAPAAHVIAHAATQPTMAAAALSLVHLAPDDEPQVCARVALQLLLLLRRRRPLCSSSAGGVRAGRRDLPWVATSTSVLRGEEGNERETREEREREGGGGSKKGGERKGNV